MDDLIPESHIENFCKPGKGASCCRYLCFGDKGWECLKLTDAKRYLDQKAAIGGMVAQSDNCKGIKSAVKGFRGSLRDILEEENQ